MFKLELRPLPGLSRADAETIGEINELLVRGIDRFGDVVAAAARKFMTLDEAVRAKLKAAPNPGYAWFAGALERVAAREMHPRLAIASGMAARYLAKMDYATQARAVENLLEVVLPNDDVTRKPVDQLSREETAQVFDLAADPPDIRNREAQRAWLAARKLAEARRQRQERSTKLIVVKGKYRIANSHFFPLKDRFSMRELEGILENMRRLKG